MFLSTLRGTALGCLIAFLIFATPRASIEQKKSENKEKDLSPGWPMLGGTPSRNMVNPAAGSLSHVFPKGGEDGRTPVPGTRVKWKAATGGWLFAQPVVAGGKVLIGTNNDNPRNPRDRGKPTDDEPAGTPLDLELPGQRRQAFVQLCGKGQQLVAMVRQGRAGLLVRRPGWGHASAQFGDHEVELGAWAADGRPTFLHM